MIEREINNPPKTLTVKCVFLLLSMTCKYPEKNYRDGCMVGVAIWVATAVSVTGDWHGTGSLSS